MSCYDCQTIRGSQRDKLPEAWAIVVRGRDGHPSFMEDEEGNPATHPSRALAERAALLTGACLALGFTLVRLP